MPRRVLSQIACQHRLDPSMYIINKDLTRRIWLNFRSLDFNKILTVLLCLWVKLVKTYVRKFLHAKYQHIISIFHVKNNIENSKRIVFKFALIFYKSQMFWYASKAVIGQLQCSKSEIITGPKMFGGASMIIVFVGWKNINRR